MYAINDEDDRATADRVQIPPKRQVETSLPDTKTLKKSETESAARPVSRD